MSADRRSVLAALAGAASFGGCASALGGSSERVQVLCAGSLQSPLGELDSRLDIPVAVEARGSAAAAQLVADGVRDPDVVALADAALFESVLDPEWYALVATNELAVAYGRETPAGRRIREADRWFEPILAGDVVLGRTDPDLDPLGYRTLFALELAARRHDRPGLPDAVLEPDQIYPETGLLSRFETGDVDAAVVYRSMAVERDYDYRELHPAVDLSDPDRDEEYRTASHTLADGRTVRGEHVAYGVQARSADAATRAAFDTLVAGDLLRERGFEVPERFPVSEGAVPRGYA